MGLETCKWPEGCENLTEGNTDYCGKHNRLIRKMDTKAKDKFEKQQQTREDQKAGKKSIPQISEKMQKRLDAYYPKAKKFKEGKRCAVLGNLVATEVHHMRGRDINTFYDDWAREHDLPLLLDERFWLAVSHEGHRKITENPQWAIKMGYSYERLKKV